MKELTVAATLENLSVVQTFLLNRSWSSVIVP